MRSTLCTALVLATVTIGNVVAGPVKHAHAHFYGKKEAKALIVEATVEKRDNSFWNGINFNTVSITYSSGQTWGEPTPAPVVPVVPAAASPTPVSAPPAEDTRAAKVDTVQDATEILSSDDAARLVSLGLLGPGKNAKDPSGGAWIGTNGDYVMELVNKSPYDLIVACWGSQGSWVNVHQCTITVTLKKNSRQTISFGNNHIGACAPIYPDTTLVDGQLHETWIEFTFGPMGAVDVSREVNMSGHPISVVGPLCTTDFNQCVFECISGNSCMTGYVLKNCGPGSQPGAQYGLDNGAPSGGCGGLGNSAKLVATFS